MRRLVLWSVLLYAAHPVHAGCDRCFFRVNQISGESDIVADAGGYVEWTNAVTGGTTTVEKAVSLAGDDSWNPFAVSEVTSTISRIRVYDPRPPRGMVLIPVGIFLMGSDADLYPETSGNEMPVHQVSVSELYMDATEVTKATWDEVWSWAVTNGYSFDHDGEGKAPNHPVHSISWYDMVKWCNARSEREGRIPSYYTNAALDPGSIYRSGSLDIENDWVRWNTGYRLPTEAEWEKAARGGPIQARFPWTGYTNRISHVWANYFGQPSEYDLSSGLHPAFGGGELPQTSPVGYFAPNGYCLVDMAGNVWEWCWDRFDPDYYVLSPVSDPRGPEAGDSRTLRGGSWNGGSIYCRVTYRDDVNPAAYADIIGFRCVLSSPP